MYRDEWLFSIYMILLRDFVPEWNSRSGVEIRVTSHRHGISGGVMWTNSEAQERNKMNSLQHESRLGILNAISEFRSEVITTLTWRKDGVFACGLIRENEDSKMSISPNNSCFCGQTKEQGFLFLVFFFPPCLSCAIQTLKIRSFIALKTIKNASCGGTCWVWVEKLAWNWRLDFDQS